MNFVNNFNKWKNYIDFVIKRINPLIIVFLLLMLYIVPTYLGMNYERVFYNTEYKCARIVDVIKESTFKGQPSIIIENKGNNYELFLAYGYEYNFGKLEIGDIICKKSRSFNFILQHPSNKSRDTFIYSDGEGSFDEVYINRFEINDKVGNINDCKCFK